MIDKTIRDMLTHAMYAPNPDSYINRIDALNVILGDEGWPLEEEVEWDRLAQEWESRGRPGYMS